LVRLIINPSFVAAITAIVQGPFGVQGPWHSVKVPPSKDGPVCSFCNRTRSLWHTA